MIVCFTDFTFEYIIIGPKRLTPEHPSVQYNPGLHAYIRSIKGFMDLIIQLYLENIGSSLPKSVGEGIGISPSPLPKGWWRETGNVYKSAGWMLKPSNTTRLGYKKKSVGSPGSLGLSIIY
jgi:hypothetical protein